MADHRGMSHETDNGAWDHHWSSTCQKYAGTVSPAGPFEMPFIRHGNEVAYVRRLYALFQRYHERSTEEDGFE